MDQILANLGYSDKIQIFRDLKINPNSFQKIVQIEGGISNLKSDTGLQLGEIVQILDAVQNLQQSTVQSKQSIMESQLKNEALYRQQSGMTQKIGSQVNSNMNRQRITSQNAFQNQPNINFQTKFGRNNRLAKLMPNSNQQVQVAQVSSSAQNQFLQSSKQKNDQRYDYNNHKNLENRRESYRQQSDIDTNQENQQYLVNNFPQKLNENKVINGQLKNSNIEEIAKTNKNIVQYNHESQQPIKSEQVVSLNENKTANQNIKYENIIKKDQLGNNILNQNSQEYIFQQLQQHSNEKIQKVKDYEYSDKSSEEQFEIEIQQNSGKFVENKQKENINDFNQISTKLISNQFVKQQAQQTIQDKFDDVYRVTNEGSEQQDYDDQSEQSISELSEQSIKKPSTINTQCNPPILQKFEMPSNMVNIQNTKQHQSRPTIGVKQPASLSQRQVCQSDTYDNRNLYGSKYEDGGQHSVPKYSDIQENNIYVDNQQFDQNKNGHYQNNGSNKNSQQDETSLSNEEFNYNDQNMEDYENQRNQPIDENNSESNLSSAQSIQNQPRQQEQFQSKAEPNNIDKEDINYCQSESNEESDIDIPSDAEFNQKTQRLKQQSLWGGIKQQTQEAQLNNSQNEQIKNFSQEKQFQKAYDNNSQMYSQEEEGECENSYGDEEQDFQYQNNKQDHNNYNPGNDKMQTSSQQSSEEQSDLNQSDEEDIQRIEDIQEQIPEQINKIQNEGVQETKQQTANISENTFLDAPQYEEEDPEQHDSGYQSEKNQDQQLNFEFKIPKDQIQKKVNQDPSQIKQDQRFLQLKNEQNFQKQQFIQRDFLSHLQHNNSFSTNNPELHHLMMQNDDLLLQSTTINNVEQQRNLNQKQIAPAVKTQIKTDKDKMGNFSYANNYGMNINEFQIKNFQSLDSNMTENTFQQPVNFDQYQDREALQKYHNYQKIDQGYKPLKQEEYNQAYPSEEKQSIIDAALSPSKILNDQSLFKRQDIKGSSGQANKVLHSIDKNDNILKINKLQQSGEQTEQRQQKKQEINQFSTLQNQNLQRNFNLDLQKDSMNQFNQKKQLQNQDDQQIRSSRKSSLKCDREISAQDDLLEKIFQDAKHQNQQEIQLHKQLLESKQVEINQQNIKNLEEIYYQKFKKETQEILQKELEKNKNTIQAILDEKVKLQQEVDSGFDSLKSQYKLETDDLQCKIANKTEEVQLLKLKINTLLNQVENANSNINQKDQEMQLERSQKEKLQTQLSEKQDLYNQAKDIIKTLQQENLDKDQIIKQERDKNQNNIDAIQNEHKNEIKQMIDKYEEALAEISSLKLQLNQLQEQYNQLLQKKSDQRKQENVTIDLSKQNTCFKNTEVEIQVQPLKNYQEPDLQSQLQQLIQKKRELEIINQKLFKESDCDMEVQLIDNQSIQQIAIQHQEVKTQGLNNHNSVQLIESSAGKQRDEFLSQAREESSYLPEIVPEEDCDKKKIIKKVRFHDDEQLVSLPHKPLKVHPKIGQKRLRQDLYSGQENNRSMFNEDMIDLNIGQERNSQNTMREDSNEPSKTYLDQECDIELKKAQKLSTEQNGNSQNHQVSQKSKRQKTESCHNSQSGLTDSSKRRTTASDIVKDQGDIISNKLNKVFSEDASDSSLNNLRQRKQSKRSKRPIQIQSSSGSESPLPENLYGSTNGGCNSTSAQSQSQQLQKHVKKFNNQQNQYGQKMKEHMSTIDKNLLQSNPNLAKMLQKIMKK